MNVDGMSIFIRRVCFLIQTDKQQNSQILRCKKSFLFVFLLIEFILECGSNLHFNVASQCLFFIADGRTFHTNIDEVIAFAAAYGVRWT